MEGCLEWFMGQVSKTSGGVSSTWVRIPSPPQSYFYYCTMSDMTIRLATAQDKQGVLRIFDEFSALLNASDVPSVVGGKIFDEVISREDTHVFIAEDDGEIVGVATLYLLPNIRHGWRRGHIEDFFVTSTKRSRGVGTALFTAIKEYCRDHSIKVIKLDSGNELVKAHSFYEKHGGKTTERFFRFDLE